jgi:uncharacterized protein (DUF1330 family)
MVHLIWFERPDGPEKFRTYLEAASPIAQRYGARRVDSLIPFDAIQGGVDPDYMFIVEWPNEEAFKKFMKDPGYRAAAGLRQGACKRRALFMCRRPPGWTETDPGT